MDANDFRVGSQKLVEPLKRPSWKSLGSLPLRDLVVFREESQKLVELLKRLPEETILEIFGKLPLRDLLVF
ncbi:hypothetical protein MKW92_051105, partial [Papaver armeniacum]